MMVQGCVLVRWIAGLRRLVAIALQASAVALALGMPCRAQEPLANDQPATLTIRAASLVVQQAERLWIDLFTESILAGMNPVGSVRIDAEHSVDIGIKKERCETLKVRLAKAGSHANDLKAVDFLVSAGQWTAKRAADWKKTQTELSAAAPSAPWLAACQRLGVTDIPKPD